MREKGKFASLIIGFKAKRMMADDRRREKFASLIIGFKAKQKESHLSDCWEFASLIIGFKAKRMVSAPSRKEEFASLIIGFKAKQTRPICETPLQFASLIIGFKAKRRGDVPAEAAATISHADAIVSWNFKHIVNLGKMKAYNEVNIREGYSMLTVLSPKEVNFDDTE